jgi:hypothetical protein
MGFWGTFHRCHPGAAPRRGPPRKYRRSGKESYVRAIWRTVAPHSRSQEIVVNAARDSLVTDLTNRSKKAFKLGGRSSEAKILTGFPDTGRSHVAP